MKSCTGRLALGPTAFHPLCIRCQTYSRAAIMYETILAFFLTFLPNNLNGYIDNEFKSSSEHAFSIIPTAESKNTFFKPEALDLFGNPIQKYQFE